MKIPKSASDVYQEIIISSDKYADNADQRIKQLVQLLKMTDSELVVEGIISVFEESDRGEKTYQDQELAGYVLDAIKPKSTKELSEVLRRILKHWDKSIEQLPRWLKRNYGAQLLQQAAHTLPLTEVESQKMNTVLFWISHLE